MSLPLSMTLHVHILVDHIVAESESHRRRTFLLSALAMLSQMQRHLHLADQHAKKESSLRPNRSQSHATDNFQSTSSRSVPSRQVFDRTPARFEADENSHQVEVDRSAPR